MRRSVFYNILWSIKRRCHAEMWSAGYNNGNGGKIFNDKSKNSFWERRIENKKRIENQVKKQQEKSGFRKNKRKEQLMKNMRKIKGYPLRMPELDWWLRVVRLPRLSQ